MVFWHVKDCNKEKIAKCYSSPLRIGWVVMSLNCCRGENALSFRIIKHWKRLPGKLWILHHWRFFKKIRQASARKNAFFISAWDCG